MLPTLLCISIRKQNKLAFFNEGVSRKCGFEKTPQENKILPESCEATTTQTLLIFIDSLQKILLALPLSEKIAIP